MIIGNYMIRRHIRELGEMKQGASEWRPTFAWFPKRIRDGKHAGDYIWLQYCQYRAVYFLADCWCRVLEYRLNEE